MSILSFQILPKLNLNISPCSDFRNYVCGTWFSSNPLPDDNSEWNMKELMLLKCKSCSHTWVCIITSIKLNFFKKEKERMYQENTSVFRDSHHFLALVCDSIYFDVKLLLFKCKVSCFHAN